MLNFFDDTTPPDTLQVKVTPKAKTERIKKEVRDDGTALYKIYVTTVPEDGKANDAVIKLLAKAVGISKSSFTIIRGHNSRDKVIKLKGK